ncbi:MAG TPA: hypothetical protein P5235_03800 [Saprospiraceae bacterium]|nr:hypothetical protein [Saprospiraceae bacterium]
MAQKVDKVDIDNYRINITKAQFPRNYVDNENRTYTLTIKGGSSYLREYVYEKIDLRGWTEVQENGYIDIVANLRNLTQGQGSLKTDSEQKKDKNGKVSTTYKYTVNADNTGLMTLSIYGPKNEYKKPEKKKKKKKEKEKKKEEVNPFLQDVDMTEEESVDSVLPTKELAYTTSETFAYGVSSGEQSSAKSAWNRFNQIASTEYNSQLQTYAKGLSGAINKNINFYYGIPLSKDWAKFKILDKDKHPEFETYQQACKAMKTMFEKMSYKSDIEKMRNNFHPIIDYFQTIPPKYNTDNKHHKNLRASAWYNLAQIYYYLDMPDEMIAIGNDIIKSDHDKGDGEDFVEKGTELKNEMTFFQTDTRQMKLKQGESEDVEIDEEAIEESSDSDE